MKKFFLLLLCTSFLITSCGSDDDFDNDTIGRTFDEIVTFDATNNFAVEIIVPDNIEVFNADVALVFVRDPERSAAEQSDVWEPLPRTLFFPGGGFAQYQFNFIFNEEQNIASLELFLESDNLGGLAPDITNNQRFRIVIVPSAFAQDDLYSYLGEDHC